MKKLIYVFALGALITISSCKKEETGPAATTATAEQGDEIFCFRYNYLKPNDPLEYAGVQCMTDAEALHAKQLYGYYNFVKKGPGWCTNCP